MQRHDTETDTGAARDAYVAALESKVRSIEKENEQLREELGYDPDVDTHPNGTPSRVGEVSTRLGDGPTPSWLLDQIPDEDATLHNMLDRGADALVSGHNPVYPVHERAVEVFVNAGDIARKKAEGGNVVYLTAPTAKNFLESPSVCDERLKHTQIRRAFEQIEQAGKKYPRPPTLHKNRDDVIELVIYDYEKIVRSRGPSPRLEVLRHQ